MVEVESEKSEDRSHDADIGILVNKQARKRAEEKLAEVNDNKRRKHIEPHQKIMNLSFPAPISTKLLRLRMSRLTIDSSMAQMS
eukprot:13767122-Heterocapsa_arctica.AAC.1